MAKLCLSSRLHDHVLRQSKYEVCYPEHQFFTVLVSVMTSHGTEVTG
jgi:hypothetical protein